MSDEPKEPIRPSLAVVAEMTSVHVVFATLIMIFFRWQGKDGTFWQAGDESFIANGFTGLVDVLYWLFKPRIMRWRGTE